MITLKKKAGDDKINASPFSHKIFAQINTACHSEEAKR
jgi:hypothetical protein